MVQEGVKIYSTQLSAEEYFKQLKLKILEEAQEVVDCQDDEELTIELADVMEVIYSIAALRGISKERIESERLIKKDINGTFSPLYYINYIKVEKDNHKVIEYLQNSKRKYILS
jgi:predicted house-cleaning noncanonical NTP pyrophosphatase (MazG superfamily)